MNMTFLKGKESIPFSLPDKNLIATLLPHETKKIADEETLIRESLKSPIGTGPLSSIVKPGEKICIITSDITRPLPSYKVLPPVLYELSAAGIPKEDILIVFALGCHRAHTEAEMRALVGEEIFASYRCVDSVGDFIHVGQTPNGTPVDIFAPVMKADRRICLGNVEFHYFAGYSGGAKAIMPGVSTRDAIQANHAGMVKDTAAAGRLIGNPVRDDIEYAADMVGIDFIVNVVLDEKKRIVASAAGHHVKAHRAACQMLDAMYTIDIPEKADIVMVSPGGFPKDINIYQAQKALDNAKHAVKDGGIIIWVASCKEGFGEHVFEEWMLGHNRMEDMIPHIQEDFQLGGHKAAAIALVKAKADIYLVSDLPDDLVRRIHLTPFGTPDMALEHAMDILGDDASIILMPFGGATLPRLKTV